MSVNYLFIEEEDIIRLPKLYAINLHGSLLPKYRGRTPHAWAIINGETETGVTAHLMNVQVDDGAIVAQVKVPIGPDDTGATILECYQTIYPRLLDQLLSAIESNTLRPIPQDRSLATYFGKRPPADGQIDWSWHRERIRNWIRAQAKPYPGAFCFYQDQKITIHKATLSQQGFSTEQPNGLIVAVTSNALVVKTPNGCLELTQIACSPSIDWTVGMLSS